MQHAQTAPLVFFSYAHEDEEQLTTLRQHLSLMQRQGMIRELYDRQILAGTPMHDAISDRLEQANVVLLLVTAAFMASDYCQGIEVRRALEKHRNKEAIVIPIIGDHVDWKTAPFGGLQALPRDGKPVTAWPTQSEAWFQVASGIRAVIEHLQRNPQP